MKWIIASVFTVLIIVGGIFFFKGANTDSENPNPVMETTTTNIVQSTIQTSKGDIVLELYKDVAPKTVENFITLSQSEFYDGTKFHRVIPEFMIQGGDPLSRTDNPRVGTGGPGYTFADEINPRALGLSEEVIQQHEARGYQYRDDLQSLPVTIGAVAMANAGPNTNGSQFFIVTMQDQPHLNGLHTVFGKVIGGIDVVRSIQQGDVIIGVQTK